MPPTVKSGIKGQLKGFTPSTLWFSSLLLLTLLMLIGYMLFDSRVSHINHSENEGDQALDLISTSKPIRTEAITTDISIDQPVVADEIPRDSIDTEIGAIAKDSYTVAKGDSLLAILFQYGINTADGLKLVTDYPKLSQLKVGQKLSWEVDAQGNLLSLEWHVSRRLIHKYVLSKEQYQELVEIKEGNWTDVILSGVIDNNFIFTARNVGLSNNEINNVIKALQWKIDFNRLPPNTKFATLFSREILDDTLADSILLGVSLVISGTRYYAFLAEDGNYYDEKGLSLASGFLRYPLHKPARISSAFNPRRLHPITGRIAPHNGVDFAIPTGTPIVASGDGEVMLAKYSGAAGNYVAIRHGRQYLTRYMHLSKILVKPGQKVKRGDTIALSGNTGRSTGPHLHYEFHVNGKPVNPMTVKLPQADSLKGQRLTAYQSNINKWKQMLVMN